MLHFLKYESNFLILDILDPSDLKFSEEKKFKLWGVAIANIQELKENFELKAYFFPDYRYVLSTGTHILQRIESPKFWEAKTPEEDSRLRNFVRNSKRRTKARLETEFPVFDSREAYIREELEAHSLIDYMKIIDELGNVFSAKTGSQVIPSVLYRGQSESHWPLIPSLFRRTPRLGGNTFPNWETVMDLIYSAFRKRVHPFMDDKNLSPQDLLALGQHNGLPTNLLDWTSNPLIALYFACAKKGKDSKAKGGAVWTVKADFSLKADNPSDAFFRPSVVSPFIQAQQGWFSEHKPPQRLLKFKPLDELKSSPWNSLVKITIPETIKPVVISELKGWGIDESSVFPSLGGVARDLAMELSDNPTRTERWHILY
jgi:hypothetical protein